MKHFHATQYSYPRFFLFACEIFTPELSYTFTTKELNMDLREYLYRNRLTVKEFSKIVNYDRIYISSIKNGLKIPGRKCKDIILKATKGKVFEFPTSQEQREREIYDIEEQNKDNSIA
jgi:hypothetical protein